VHFTRAKSKSEHIIIPFAYLQVLNELLSPSVLPHNFLVAPTHDQRKYWQEFESLHGYYQKALVDALIYVRLAKDAVASLSLSIAGNLESLSISGKDYWDLSDVFRGAIGNNSLLEKKITLRHLHVYVEKKKFLALRTSIGKLQKSVVCQDNVPRELDNGIRCHIWAFLDI
jgi:hypothetical protein